MADLFLMKRLLILFLWFPAAIITLGLCFSLCLDQTTQQTGVKTALAQNPSFYPPFPQVLGFSTQAGQENEPLVKTVSQYLSRYHSPMTETSSSLVGSAEKYGIDPFFLTAIAQCETNLGKKSYENCFNPFGLGIHSQGRLCFPNWEASYEKMARVLRESYFNQGLVSPEEIMTVYCPQSLEKGGSWAKCIRQYQKEIENFSQNTL